MTAEVRRERRHALRVRGPWAGGIVARMSENTSTPSEQPYDPAKDPDADPEQLEREESQDQPSQAEGEDRPGAGRSS